MRMAALCSTAVLRGCSAAFIACGPGLNAMPWLQWLQQPDQLLLAYLHGYVGSSQASNPAPCRRHRK